MRGISVLAAVVGLALVVAATPAEAQKSPRRTVAGCVHGKAFFRVDGTAAYRMTLPAAFDATTFEGQGVSLTGLSYPGERFDPEPGTTPKVTAKTCPAAALRAIKNTLVVRLRIDAERAATAGDFPTAHARIDEAFALVKPPTCDSFSDRAEIFAREGNYAAVKNDLAVLRARKRCSTFGGVNSALIQDVGTVLESKGESKLAITAFEIARAACDDDQCRTEVDEQIAEAKQP